MNVGEGLLLNAELPGADGSKVPNSSLILVPRAHHKDETGSQLLEWKIPSLLWQQIAIMCSNERLRNGHKNNPLYTIKN